MQPERWRLIDELFHSAIELPETERGDFLERACEGDACLQAEVEELIQTCDEAASFMETPPLPGETITSALAMREELVAAAPDDTESNTQLARIYESLGACYSSMAATEKRIDDWREARLARGKALVSTKPGDIPGIAGTK